MREREAALTAEIVTFDQALAESDGQPRDILLGNGFSIGAHPPFTYGGLLQTADLDAEVRAIRKSDHFMVVGIAPWTRTGLPRGRRKALLMQLRTGPSRFVAAIPMWTKVSVGAGGLRNWRPTVAARAAGRELAIRPRSGRPRRLFLPGE